MSLTKCTTILPSDCQAIVLENGTSHTKKVSSKKIRIHLYDWNKISKNHFKYIYIWRKTNDIKRLNIMQLSTNTITFYLRNCKLW